MPNKVRVPSKAGDLYLSVFTIITEINDTKTLTRLTSFEVNANLMVQKVIQIRSGITMNILLMYENKNKHSVCEKYYIYNPARCSCENDK